MYKTFVSIAVLFLFSLLSTANAEFYYWTDQKGVSYATDDLSKVPEEYRAQALSNKAPDEETTNTTRKEQEQNESYAVPKMKKAKKEQAGAAADQNGRGEAYWRARADGLRERIHELEDDYKLADQQERACVEDHRINYLGKRPDCASIYGAEKSRIERALERARKSLEVDLPDEARKSGAYPGWLR